MHIIFQTDYKLQAFYAVYTHLGKIKCIYSQRNGVFCNINAYQEGKKLFIAGGIIKRLSALSVPVTHGLFCCAKSKSQCLCSTFWSTTGFHQALAVKSSISPFLSLSPSQQDLVAQDAHPHLRFLGCSWF